MLTKLPAYLLPAVVALQPVGAEQFYRCIGDNGVTVYSRQPCGPDAEIKTVEDQPTGEQPSAVDQLQRYRDKVRRIDRMLGQDKTPRRAAKPATTDACDRVSKLSLRNARISGDIRRCHSEDDVRGMFGAPDSTYEWSDKRSYDTRWTYRDDSRRETTYIYFKDGRVTRWNRRIRKN